MEESSAQGRVSLAEVRRTMRGERIVLEGEVCCPVHCRYSFELDEQGAIARRSARLEIHTSGYVFWKAEKGFGADGPIGVDWHGYKDEAFADPEALWGLLSCVDLVVEPDAMVWTRKNAWAPQYEMLSYAEARDREGGTVAVCTHCEEDVRLDEDDPEHPDDPVVPWPALCEDCENEYLAALKARAPAKEE